MFAAKAQDRAPYLSQVHADGNDATLHLFFGDTVGWKKSCTKLIRNLSVYPIIHRVIYPGGCLGFLPSTVCFVEE